MQSLTWGLVIGGASPIPYFYSVFFITVLVHRCGRDFERYVGSLFSSCGRGVYTRLLCRCAIKYGKDWERYCEKVPYKFVPYVY